MLNNSFSAKSFKYSLDWRFFIGFSPISKILYIGEAGEEVKSFFESFDIPHLHYLDDLSFSNKVKYLNDMFDIIVIPYGISFKEEDIFILRSKLKNKGVLLIGFMNRFRNNHKYSNYLFNVKKILRKTGFSILKSYGIFPQQYNPEYVFPLMPQAIKFATYHRYQYKLPVWLLKIISSTAFAFIVLNFLPAYYVVAEIFYE